MKELLRELDPTNIGYLQSILENEGIATFIRNDNLSRVEVPIPIFWPALCVVNDDDFERALGILNDFKNQRKIDKELSETEWVCPKCDESNPGNFEICWSCNVPQGE